jgi:nucleoside-diphosphate-sugar epimerase
MATLVTGAFGCIGAWVCKRLPEAGEKPVAFDVAEHKITRIDGIRKMLDEFAALQKAGRLDARELEPAK